LSSDVKKFEEQGTINEKRGPRGVILLTRYGASFYQFPLFRRFSGIDHAVFARQGGYSQAPFNSLNVSLGLGDDAAAVHKNRRIISECMHRQQLVFANQVHGDQVIVCSGAEQDAGIGESASAFSADALVTDIPRSALVIQVADCQAVMIYDPERQVVANVHVGWRGSIQNILARTLRVLEQRFGCQAGHLVAGIGPSLGPCCAEFVNYQSEIPQRFWDYKDKDHHFDFWAISYDQLVEAGVRPENIANSRMCTKCNTDIFFSYRGQGRTGRFAALIGLR
jgi:YfiH family protein